MNNTTTKTTTTTREVPTSSSTVQAIKLAPVTKTVTQTESSTSTTLPPTTSTAKVIPQMPQRGPTLNQTSVNETKPSEPPKDYLDVFESNDDEGEDEHDVERDDIFLSTSSYETDNIMKQGLMMKKEMNPDHDGIDASFIIKVSIIVISTVSLSLLIFIIVYKQYKKSTNPLNYKEKHENGSRKANEEFSEIRFLTSDETLDFNLATPENITDL